MTYLVEIDAYTLPSGPLVTFRYSSGKGFRTLPTDTPANTFISPRIDKQTYALRRDLFDKATTYGAIGQAKGQLVLINEDGALDALLGYGLDGRQVRVYQGTEGTAFPSAWTQVGTAYIDTVSYPDFTVTLTLQDRLQTLDKPLLPTKYLGNNSLPNGLEGVADIKDQYKPRLYGQVLNIQPILVNTSLFAYQVSDQQATVSAVYDRGSALTASAAYSDQNDLQTNAPTASHYRVLATSSGTYIRLGSTPVGAITCDCATTETKAAALIKQIALDMGIASGDINSSDVTALNTANSAAVGTWATGDTHAIAVMSELASAVGASFSFDQTAKLRMQQLVASSGSPVATIRKERIISLSLISTADSDQGIPPWQVRLGYAKNWTTQNDLNNTNAGAVQAAFAAVEYRRVTVQDTAVQTAHPNSLPIEIDTCLVSASDASTEANRRLTLYKVGRQMYQVKARLESATLALIDLGVCLTIIYPRYGLDSGKLLRVLGITVNAEMNEIDLRLWG